MDKMEGVDVSAISDLSGKSSRSRLSFFGPEDLIFLSQSGDFLVDVSSWHFGVRRNDILSGPTGRTRLAARAPFTPAAAG
jgi:hypothetical protein